MEIMKPRGTPAPEPGNAEQPAEGLPPGGEPVDEPDLAWDAWTPPEVVRRLAGVAATWYVAGGWAVDLHLGRVSRAHDDLEIAVPASDFDAIRRALAGFEFDVVGAGRRWPATDATAFRLLHQTWVRDPVTGAYRLDVFREPHDGTTWICRRNPTVRLPYRRVVRHTPTGVPYLAPEIVLLFKAKARRPKDEADLANLVPLLDGGQRDWLARALAATHPGHPWLEVI
jgi:hypothetical protein